MVLNDHSGKLTFSCGLKLPLCPPEKKDIGRPGNLVCMLFFSDDHDSPHTFVPRKRLEGNCTISSDSLILPSLTHHVRAPSHASMTYVILSPHTPSPSKYLAHTPKRRALAKGKLRPQCSSPFPNYSSDKSFFLYLLKKKLEKDLDFYVKSLLC